jgi:hypothetical protein
MEYSKAKLNSTGDKASLYFGTLWKGKFSNVYTLLNTSFKHILNRLASFMGTSNSIRILYNTFLLTES